MKKTITTTLTKEVLVDLGGHAIRWHNLEARRCEGARAVQGG